MNKHELAAALEAAASTQEEQSWPVKVLTEEGEIFDILLADPDPELSVIWLKAELSE